jgi:hypothetical protein
VSGGSRCSEEDGFRFAGVEAKAVGEEPATVHSCTLSKVAGIISIVVVQCSVELRIVSILVVINIECRDDVGDWSNVEREQDGPQDRTLWYIMVVSSVVRASVCKA